MEKESQPGQLANTGSPGKMAKSNENQDASKAAHDFISNKSQNQQSTVQQYRHSETFEPCDPDL